MFASRRLRTTRPLIAFTSADRDYNVHVWNKSLRRFEPGAALSIVTLARGAVFIDGRRIAEPRFGAHTVSWCQKTAAGFSSGALHFTHDRLSFAGVVYLGTRERDAIAHEVCGAVPPTVYDTLVGDAATPAASVSSPGLTVTLGYRFEHPGQLPVPVLEIGGTDATAFAALVANDQDMLELDISFDQTIAAAGYGTSPLWPAAAAIVFANDGNTFTGTMNKYDPATESPSAQTFAWTGKARPSAVVRPQLSMAVPAQIALDDLSIAELVSISPPKDGLRTAAFNLLVENMKWAMDQDWLAQFFGETRPQLDAKRIAVINQNADFYQQRFAPAYLGWGFSSMTGEGAPTHTLSADEKTMLETFLHSGLAGENGYNEQNAALVVQAFLMTAPRLQKYIDDGGDKWAAQLYAATTTVPQINLMMNRLIATHSMELVNNTATVLTCLQPSGDLAGKYHKIFTCRATAKLSREAVFTDRDKIMEWMPDMIQQFINTYLVAPENPTQTQLRLQEAAKELAAAVEKAGTVAELAASFTDALIALQNLNMDNLAAAESRLARYGAKIGGLLKFVAFAGGLVYAIQGFLAWNKLDAEGRARAVLTTIKLFGDSVAASVPKLLEWGQKLSLDDTIALELEFSDEDLLGQMYGDIEDIEPDWVAVGADEVGAAFDGAGRRIVTTEWSKLFKNIEKAMKWMGAAVAAAFAILSTIDFVNDIKNGSSTKKQAFDGIIAVSGMLETVCLVLDIVADFAAVPFVGAVFAVIGLVFMLVEMFEPQPKPESPVDKFMDNVLKPFIATLPPAQPAVAAAAA